MSDWLLAEINVAEAMYDLEDAAMAGFTGRIEEINALAERADGFVWRLKTEELGPADLEGLPNNPRLVLNMSVWRDFQSLSDYIFRSDHLELMQARHSWFKTSREPTLCFWWIPATGPMPTAAEGWERLSLLRSKGPTPAAFPMKRRFSQPEIASADVAPPTQGLAAESATG